MANDKDPWGREYTGAEQSLTEIRESGFRGPVDRNGEAVMSRTDPRDGQALDLTARGSGGHGTPDQGLVARWRGLRG